MANDELPDDNPQPMSQEEIDALFEQMANDMPEEEVEGDTTSSASKKRDMQLVEPPRPEPSDNSRTSAGTQADLRQSDIDRMIGGLDDADEPVPEPEPEPKPAVEPAAEAGGSMGQDDIDALLAEMGAVDVPASEPKPAAAGPMGQDDIDALLAEMGAVDEPAAEPEPADDGPLGQDDIDALLADLGGGDSAPAEPAAEAAADGPMGQDAIDALLAEMGAGPEPAAEEAVDTGAMGQDDIDALLASMGAGEEVPAAQPEPAAADGPLDQDAIDALLAEVAEDAPAQPDPEVTLAADANGDIDTGAMGQDDIDALLAEMGVGAAVDTKPGVPGHDTERLSTQQIASIIQKQETTATTDDSPEDSAESMISQDDIDALVRQMSMATVVPDKDRIDEMLSEQEQDIEALLDEAQRGSEVTDAVQGSMTPMVPQFSQPAAVLPNGAAVMAPDELRGSRYLLMAAVFLLAMCTMTMVFVANAINGLTGELREGRRNEVLPQDGYEQDVAVGLELLNSDDAVEVEKGLRFFELLKKQYRGRPAESKELHMLLGDHHRSRDAWKRAIKEYELLMEQQGEYIDDPRFYLVYGDSLFQLERFDRAQEVLMRLLANEDRYARQVDDDGKARQAEVVRAEREVLQRAYLLLGRLYTAKLERLPSPTTGES